MSLLRILHVVGSAYNDFYCNLSREYARCTLWDTSYFANDYDFRIAYITPDDQWRFPRSLSSEDIDNAKPMSFLDALRSIKEQNIDLVLSHMYCIPGMTHYRALFDLLKIPYIANSPDLMALTAHKGKTKAIVAAAGVKVPPGELLRPGDQPTIEPPVVVKPANADNSLGVSYVKQSGDYDAALKKAFQHADEVLVEKFIEPGREVRGAVIVKDGKFIDLPIEEFLIDAEHLPIRNYAAKFSGHDENEKFQGWAKSNTKQNWIVDVDDPVTRKVQDAVKKCHLALGCRYYSMFDFRIDPNGEPWFLEAGLYCSFGYGSGIPHTAQAAGIPLDELFKIMVKETLKNHSNVV